MAEKRRLIAEMADADALSSMERAATIGTAIPWTYNTDPAYSLEKVERTYRDALRSCPQAATAHTYLDCDEYPCVLWGEIPSEEEGGMPSGLRDGTLPPILECPAWSYSLESSPFLSYGGSRHPSGGYAGYVFMPLMPRGQEGPFGLDDLGRRLDYRRESGREVFLEEWHAEEEVPR